MAKVSVAAKLKALQAKWKAATPRSGGGLPDGDYEGVIKTALIKVCKNDELQCVWEMEVTGPEGFVGRKHTKSAYLGGESSLDWFKGDLAMLGVDPPEDTSEIPSAAAQTEGLPVAFRVKSKQENTNTYFLGVLEGETVEEPDATPDANADVLTADAVTAMGEADDEEGLQGVIDEYELDINQDDYETYAEVAALIIEQLEL